MGDFKDEFSPALVATLAGELRRAWPAFPIDRFTGDAAGALAPLALLARVEHLAERLAGCLPAEFPAAAAVLWRALDSASFTGWMTLPCGSFVARAGLDHPHLALPLLAGLTPRFSSEGPLRPFLERHPGVTFEYLHRWVEDPDEHVRRLVSEGTRPRLPWAPRLRRFLEDPAPTIALLERLVDDPSAYVRRSVANHLNDISKDHPDLALACGRRWTVAGDRAAWVVRHGLRTLAKRGDPEALALLGADHGADIRATAFGLDRDRIRIGEAVTFTATLVLSGPVSAEAVIDYRVHYVGARGVRSPKVFKLTRRRLVPGMPVTLRRGHRFEHVSVRRLYPGPHTIDLQVNGRVLAGATFELVDRPEPGS
ncbi:MAG TPA: hypothetical protein VM264_08070 [Acidimicrobiales bacterium]|nr:hypothetical protein [Acidimicrobiales bacterium]